MKKTLVSLAAVPFFLSSLSLFAQDEGAPAPASGGGSMTQTMVMIGVALVFFYFILWRPEQKRRKQMEQLRGTLKKGDRITAMGIIGNVVKVQENTVIISLHDGAKMELLKGAITDVQPAAEEKVEKITETP